MAKELLQLLNRWLAKCSEDNLHRPTFSLALSRPTYREQRERVFSKTEADVVIVYGLY